MCAKLQSLPVREVWIEKGKFFSKEARLRSSLPVREVWIEKYGMFPVDNWSSVTSREGSVD